MIFQLFDINGAIYPPKRTQAASYFLSKLPDVNPSHLYQSDGFQNGRGRENQESSQDFFFFFLLKEICLHRQFKYGIGGLEFNCQKKKKVNSY